ncbi:HAD-IA family hydrolase [Shimia ponticola]|uniref:HAD-IA family hydrolase n=1 Tax=Shimia ponticola TaxID=2582893 RepID=UPI0011BFDAF0|nr:HAD-IA family hydrolase [Shimia ponticola]
MLKLALFDVDGTLVDSQAHIVESMAQAFVSVGLPAPTRSETLGIVGLSLPQAMAVLAPEGPVEHLVDAYKAAYQSLRGSHGEAAASPLYDGIKGALDAIYEMDNTLLGLATGKSRRGLDHLVETHDLAWYFVTRQDADGHPSKPHPSMAMTAMAESGAEQGVMIGDTTYDLEMGRAAGLKTIGVTWGYHPSDLLAPLADVVVGAPQELPAAVAAIWDYV